MEITQVDKLIVENLADLDAAAKQILVIEKRVWTDIRELAESWATGKGWIGVFDGEKAVVNPRNWMKGGERHVWFEIGWGPGDTGEGDGEEPYFELSRYCGVNRGRLLLWLNWKGPSTVALKRKVKAHERELFEYGVLLDDQGNPYIDCTPSQSEIAEGLEQNDLAQALQPVERALNQAAKVQGLISQLVAEAAKGK